MKTRECTPIVIAALLHAVLAGARSEEVNPAILKARELSQLPSVVFNVHLKALVDTVNRGLSGGALGELHALNAQLADESAADKRLALLNAIVSMDLGAIGVFEDALVERYEKLMVKPGELDGQAEKEVEMIAVIARRQKSPKLARLFLRDVTKVRPYTFVGPRGGWRLPDVNDWKDLQGRLVSASLSCDDVDVLKEWMALADHSKEDLRLLIWWGMGFSLRDEAIEFLLKKLKHNSPEREKIVIEYALEHVSYQMGKVAKEALQYFGDIPIGALTRTETKALLNRVRDSASRVQQRLKSEGVNRPAIGLMYMDKY